MRQSNTGPTRISQKPTVFRGMVNLVFSCGRHHWKKSYFFWKEYPEYSSSRAGGNTASLPSTSRFLFLGSGLQLSRRGQGRRLIRCQRAGDQRKAVVPSAGGARQASKAAFRVCQGHRKYVNISKSVDLGLSASKWPCPGPQNSDLWGGSYLGAQIFNKQLSDFWVF